MHKQLTMTAILGLTLVLAGCQNTTSQAPTATTPAPTTNAAAIPGQYIVVLKDGASSVRAQSAGQLVSDLGLEAAGVSVLQVYSTALNGFAAKLSDANLAKLKSNSAVAYVEQDQVVKATATQTGATWGLDRIDQRNLPLNGTYTYNYTGSGVTAYIIDTGIRTTHSEFGGRASWGTNTSGDGQNTDCAGHGTHVAGTVGGSTYGVAKGVKLVAVKVLNCQGSGSNSGVIAGIDWVARNHSGPSVANMSLGGGASSAVDTAVNNLATGGVTVAVAAGNESQNACNVSPARAANVITVGNSTRTDGRSTSSNYGSCVELFAPGSSITSAWNTGDTATNTISGTSMASPHVAGTAALYLQRNPGASFSAVRSAIVNGATNNVLSNIGTGSPNKLLYTLFF
ncbi:S8 family peptidase [Deinococcus maricopensis]|uniref:Aqualysin 1 n=1 Tax=Deinococcus maricopensis (strain DSM 21211 / LMG 22137 / NRRL B-23946 / LB-34) TaxID=709986 RepID=E8U715_DEIML|nr:S8 family peptidase [Deinococcus maricopensis]ADV66854.1 Aqualysin 1 [Deinococcus maricopensis DSM 21211]